MIVCVCRNLRDHEFKSLTELQQRLEQPDKRCCKCIEYYCNQTTNTHIVQFFENINKKAHQEDK